MDGALDVAADRQFLRADLALYLCPFGDHDGRGAYLSLDVTKNSQGPMADNLADDRKARTNRGGLIEKNARRSQPCEVSSFQDPNWSTGELGSSCAISVAQPTRSSARRTLVLKTVFPSRDCF